MTSPESPERTEKAVLLGWLTAAIDASDAILAARSLEAPLGAPDEAPPGYDDVRAVLVHLLVETATHAGHLDAARELIDGRQHLVL